MGRERSLTKIFFTNLWNSLKPRQVWGKRIGTDYNGTQYYEIPVTETSTRTRPPRWFVPTGSSDFQQEIPPEWEAWLRYRRKDPPTEEEIERNRLEAKSIREKANELEKEVPKGMMGAGDASLTGKEFPTYGDMEDIPGKAKYLRSRTTANE